MARNYRVDTDYKLGLSLQSMASLRLLGIAVPDQVIYRAASVYYVRVDLSRVGDGFSNVTWIWDMISTERMYKLLSFLNGADYAPIYIKTDVRDGTVAQPHNAFKVFLATMWKPILSGEEGVPVVRTPYALQTVQIKFVNLVEQIGYL